MRPPPTGVPAHDSAGDDPPSAASIEESLAKLAVREGDVVLGKYRLVALLAASVTGAVFLASHVELGHEVAVKLLLEPFNRDAEVRARFMREAKLMSRIESDNVVRIIDVGELDDGTPLMAMESLRGQDLRQLLRDNPRGIESTRAVDLALQACLGLAAAHARGIVHRDIKPSNLFIARREDGTEALKILDFGIAKMRAGSASLSDALTNPTSLVGSPRYMAPEQITSASTVDARADVWALACILQELLTGRPVFGVKGIPNVLRMIVSDAPSPLRVALPNAPAALELAIVRALVKELPGRTPDVAAFARDLGPHATPAGQMIVARVERALARGAPPALESGTSGPVLPDSPSPRGPAAFDSASASAAASRSPTSGLLAPRVFPAGLDDDEGETRPVPSAVAAPAVVQILGPAAPVPFAPKLRRRRSPSNIMLVAIAGAVLLVAVLLFLLVR